MQIKRLVTVAAFVATGSAFWRMECRGRLGLARLDPLMSPGEISQHVHAIHGSSGFSESTSYEDLMNGDCTSCAVTQDKSAYWVPALYFRHENGSYELATQTGGLLAYYFLNSPPGQPGNITAFPNGFRMIAGDTYRRNYSINGLSPDQPDPAKSLWAQLGETTQADLAQRAIGFNCLNYAKAPEGSLYRHYLPPKDYLDQNCANGVRFELMFPSCWNGKDLDSPNHKDHVAYPDLVMEGDCPEGYPIRLPGLFYEVIWETDLFKGVPGEFVIANGDVRGFGYHADFITGWNQDFLQQAVDTCTNPSGEIQDCPIFDIQDQPTQNRCTMTTPAALASEAVSGIVGTVLPGNVAIQYGPQPATLANPPTQSVPVPVPTASYSPGAQNTLSGSYLPGQVFITHQSSTTSSSVQSSTPAPNIPHQQIEQAAPIPTAAPSSAPQESLPIISTQYITNGNLVSKIVWEEDVVYVTEFEDTTTTTTTTLAAAPVTVAAKNFRRQGHMHGHRGLHRRLNRH
ncbi:hypothetical protein VTK73DRAFT_6038 [Phialemonium thermophilum]|uniref:DUF1996 domain-containing protein n=1 Tax=Phialemonium thermophilum TaxID=223376 RepID=A0ABR3XW24_9PEZI